MPRRSDAKSTWLKRSHHLFDTRRYSKYLWFTLSVCGVWLIYKLLSSVIADPCGGTLYTAKLCGQYWKGNAGGSLCHEICQENLPFINYCGEDISEYRIFHFNNTAISKVLLKHLNPLSLEQHYGFPEEGTDMTTFNNHVINFVNEKLGPGSHEDLVKAIIKFGDLNRDSKISLGEARSLWSLLQINDFFISFIFEDSPHVPSVLGYCGDTYITEMVPNKPLYEPLNKRGILNFIFRNSHTWFWPSWEHRVKLAVGLLELTIESYQHRTEGMFYLCNLSESNIGYTYHYEPKLLDLTHVISKQQFGKQIQQNKCKSDEDCLYTNWCKSKCDIQTNTCSDELLRPNLYHICHIIKPFILPDLPKILKGDILNLFERCDKLHVDLPDLTLHHSLVYTDMKSLLWRHISNAIA